MMKKCLIPLLIFAHLLQFIRVEAGIVTQGNAKLVISANATVVTDGMVNNGTILNSGTLDNNGDFTNNGTELVEGLVKFTGSTGQTISGSSAFITVHVDNAAGVSLVAGANVTIDEVVELANGTLNAGSGLLTFLSTSVTHCAIIDNFSDAGFSGTMTGNITAQRYHAAASGTFNQHLMGAPVSGAAFSDITAVSGSNGVAVTPTADCDETQLDAASNYGSIFEFNEAQVSSCVLEGWNVRSSGNTSNGKGYAVAISGAGTVDVTGTPNLGATYTQSALNNSGWNNTSLQGNPYNSGWHLLSNPYLASVDLSYAGGNTAFDNNVQVMHTFGGFAGTYQPLSMSGTELLAPFQGFMVRNSSAGAGTFTFNEADRRLATATFQKTGIVDGLDILVEGNGFADITKIRFDADATIGYDTYYDAYKFPSKLGQPTLYTVNDDEWSSINTKPDVASTPSIPMGFQPGTDGTYTFSVEMDLPTGVTAILEDEQLGLFQNLNDVPTYSFSSLATDDWDRFTIHFSMVTDVEETFVNRPSVFCDGTTLTVVNAGVNESVTMTLYDLTGRVLLTETIQSNETAQFPVSQFATGIAVTQLHGAAFQISEKVVLR